MKKLSLLPVLTVLVLLLASMTVQAQAVGRTNSVPSVSLSWDVSTDPTVTGYNVYYGPAAGTYTNFVTVAGVNTNVATVGGLVRGSTYFFAATSLAGGLESLYSTEVSYNVPKLPGSPANPKLTVKGL